MHYDEFMATAKAAVISPQEKQLRFWVRGTKGTFKKVGDSSTRDLRTRAAPRLVPVLLRCARRTAEIGHASWRRWLWNRAE